MRRISLASFQFSIYSEFLAGVVREGLLALQLLRSVVLLDRLGLYHAGRVTTLHVLTAGRDRPRHIAGR